ncbi:hypothetical protein, partial [Priestia megaterium]|uniref:hypothetical protein n=1 Tax=Priestia megaterium TaxID=1404 RepID=UPI002FFFFCA0
IVTNLAQKLVIKFTNKNVEKVGNKVAKKWTLANAVKKFTPHQINSLKKNKGNLNKRQFESLIKEMKCYYEVVKETGEGRGRERIIYTDKKRKEKAKKEDGRQFNKGQAPAHSMYLALMVMSKIAGVDNKPRTRNAWATYFGVISPAEQDITKGIYSEEALKPYNEFMMELGIMESGEKQLFHDLAYTLKNVVRGHLQTVLDQAENLNLIKVISSWKGKVKNSKEPIHIEKDTANDINNAKAELLKKHRINTWEALNLKNTQRVKVFNAEWLEYLENVEDAEGNALLLQYIYEVLKIEVIKENAFEEFIKAHYPSEADAFNSINNEQSYHSKLLNYVVENAQKRHDRSLKPKNGDLTIDKDTKELLEMFHITEDELIAQNEDMEMRRELTSNQALVKSDRYVDCIRKIHIQLHNMSNMDLEKIKKVQRSGRSIKKEIDNSGKLYLNTAKHEELTTTEQTKQTRVSKDQQQVKKVVIKPNVESPENFRREDEYEAAMADIQDEIQEYEEKYGDKAMEHMKLDTIIRELKREVTVEELMNKVKHESGCTKEQESKEWDKLLK